MQVAEPGAGAAVKAWALEETAPELLVGDQAGDDGDQQHDAEKVDEVAADHRQKQVGMQDVDELADGHERRIADHLAAVLIDPDLPEAAALRKRHQSRGGHAVPQHARIQTVHTDVRIGRDKVVVEHAGIDPRLCGRDALLRIDQPVDFGEQDRDGPADHDHRQQNRQPKPRGRMNQEGDVRRRALALGRRGRCCTAEGFNGHNASPGKSAKPF